MNREIIEITVGNALFEAISEYAKHMGINLNLAIEHLLTQAVVDFAAGTDNN